MLALLHDVHSVVLRNLVDSFMSPALAFDDLFGSVSAYSPHSAEEVVMVLKVSDGLTIEIQPDLRCGRVAVCAVLPISVSKDMGFSLSCGKRLIGNKAARRWTGIYSCGIDKDLALLILPRDGGLHASIDVRCDRCRSIEERWERWY